MNTLPFDFTNFACRRETLRSVSRMVLPSLRPIVISSRMSGTTVVLPSSSSMMSLYMLVRATVVVTEMRKTVYLFAKF